MRIEGQTRLWVWSKSKPQSGSDILSTHFHFVPWRSVISHSCQTVLLGGFQAMSAKMADVEIFCINHFHFTFTLNLKKNSKWYTLYFLPILMPAKMRDVKFHRPFIFYVWHKGGLGGDLFWDPSWSVASCWCNATPRKTNSLPLAWDTSITSGVTDKYAAWVPVPSPC